MSLVRFRVIVLRVFIGKECLLTCGVTRDRCTGCGLIRWLFGGCVIGFFLFVLL